MSAEFIKRFRDDRKYFAIVIFILFLIFISGIVTPILLENKKDKWDEQLSDKILNIETSVNSIFEKREAHLLSVSENLRGDLRRVLIEPAATYGSLIRLINSQKYSAYSIEVLAPNGKLIAWNDNIAVKQEDLLPLSYPAGEAHFYRSDLVTYLTVTDTLLVENDQFYYLISSPIEKHYTFQNNYYKNVSFTQELSNKFFTQFHIDYNPFASPSRDGRKYSFDLLNNKSNKIGTVTFLKPSLEYSLNSLKTEAAQIQSILAVLLIFFIGLGFRREFQSLKFRLLKFFIFIIYCAIFRAITYFSGFPTNMFSNHLADPSYFSSTFGGGFVRSPVEFFITVIFLLLIAVKGFSYSLNYLESPDSSRRFKYLKFILIIPLIILFFLTLRGLNASIRSIIFDSTLRYFKEPELIPSLPALAMNLNTLIFSLSVILMLAIYVLLIISFLRITSSKKAKLYFTILFIAFEIFGILSLHLQNTPLITPVLSLVIIAVLFLLVYQICFSDARIRIYNYVYAMLAASVISITLMNYFNLELERESLKTTALEINRSNDNLLKFLLSETLSNVAKSEELKQSFFLRHSNYDAEAFILWAGSSLQKESLNSSVTILDKNLKQTGRFSVGIDDELKYLSGLIDKTDTLQVVQVNPDSTKEKILLIGLVPITERGIVLGYVSAAINENILNVEGDNFPEFLESKKNIINSVIDPEQLKIFEFSNNKLSQVYGDIYPSLDQIKPIINSDFSMDNEAWIYLSLNGENYLTYALKSTVDGQQKITSVSVLEKNLSWNLFNFFKIFIIHSIFILLLFILIFISQIKKFKYSFRTQLLIAFILISVIPVIVLAIYNRQLVKEKTQSAILEELRNQTDVVENHFKAQINNEAERDLDKIFKHTAREVGISFSVYEGTTQIFNSKEEYYKNGLFNDKLDPEAYYQMDYLNYREFLDKEKIDNYSYNTFFKRVDLLNRHLIISVNDAFNKIRLTYSVVDVDVFLFGIYSFAAILIIIISTLLANRISLPIRRLTKATGSIAHGDFNVEINNDQKGELKDLLDGFNLMTRELQKNQIELAELERENAWKEMAKQVAHEIKNPLTPMKLAVQQLIISYKDKNKNFDKMFSKISSTLLTQIESLNQIATEFSRFARMPNYKMEEIDLLPVINDTANLFLDENVEINVKAELDSAAVESDKVQLRRLFINFIRNSIQAHSSKIDITVSKMESSAQILISDNGTGIPKKYQGKIFESNFTTKEKGMGLGLKLAKRFIESTNGSVELVESSEKGTTFRIIIPLLKNKTEKEV